MVFSVFILIEITVRLRVFLSGYRVYCIRYLWVATIISNFLSLLRMTGVDGVYHVSMLVCPISHVLISRKTVRNVF